MPNPHRSSSPSGGMGKAHCPAHTWIQIGLSSLLPGFGALLVWLVALMPAPAPAQATSLEGPDAAGKSIPLYDGDIALNLSTRKAQLLRIGHPAELVVIGDPNIADATLVSENILLLTAKAAGSTNIFVLDENGKIIIDTLIDVEEDDLNRVNIRRAGEVTSYLCRNRFGCLPSEPESAPQPQE